MRFIQNLSWQKIDELKIDVNDSDYINRICVLLRKK